MAVIRKLQEAFSNDRFGFKIILYKLFAAKSLLNTWAIKNNLFLHYMQIKTFEFS